MIFFIYTGWKNMIDFKGEMAHFSFENGFERIILTGFRATGKSTVGRLLARQLNCRFIDTDMVLGEKLGSSIAQYVSQNGWAAFRRREGELLAELAEISGVVIATGGGAVLNEQQWLRFRQHSLVIWLRADAAVIRERMAADPATKEQRPVLNNGSIIAEAGTILLEREPLYQRSSDWEIETVAVEPAELVQHILGLAAGKKHILNSKITGRRQNAGK